MGGEAEDNGVSEGDEQFGQEGGAHLLDLLIRGGSGEPWMAGETRKRCQGAVTTVSAKAIGRPSA